MISNYQGWTRVHLMTGAYIRRIDEHPPTKKAENIKAQLAQTLGVDGDNWQLIISIGEGVTWGNQVTPWLIDLYFKDQSSAENFVIMHSIKPLYQ